MTNVDPDRAYDDWRQNLDDAYIEGRRAGNLQLAAALCPYLSFEREAAEWLRGWREALAQSFCRKNFNRRKSQ